MVKYIDLGAQWDEIKSVCMPKIEKLLESGKYINPDVNKIFEDNFANYCNSKYAVGVSSGQDGLKLALESLAFDELNAVIIPANTYFANILAANDKKYIPILIDCDIYYQLDSNKLAIWLMHNRFKFKNVIIMAVHLTGHPCNIKHVLDLALEYNCFVIEDCSQSHGAKASEKMVGVRGDFGVFSCQPTKNLGAIGEAGVVTTNSDTLYEKVNKLKNRGLESRDSLKYKGYNNRLDSIQAIVLNEKLRYLDKWNDNRIIVASKYDDQLKEVEQIKTPKKAKWCDKHVYHTYTVQVQNRNNLVEFLTNNNIETVINYPIPIQKQKPYEMYDRGNVNTIDFSSKIVNLPIHPYIKDRDIEQVVNKIKEFYNE